MVNLDLETRLVKALKSGKKIGLENSLLVASGVKSKSEFKAYKDLSSRLKSDLRERFQFGDTAHPIMKTKFMHEFLWEQQPKRYKKGAALLTDSLISQYASDRENHGANCVGMDSLALNLADYLEVDGLKFLVGRGHVKSFLDTPNGKYAFESTSPDGFFMLPNKEAELRFFEGFQEAPVQEGLVASYLNSRAALTPESELGTQRDLVELAYELMPQAPTIATNYSQVLVKEKSFKKALEVFENMEEVGIEFTFADSYRKAVSTQRVGDNFNAIRQFNDLNDDKISKHRKSLIEYNLGKAHLDMGNSNAAIKHFEDSLDLGYTRDFVFQNLAAAHYSKGNNVKAACVIQDLLDEGGSQANSVLRDMYKFNRVA